jgi:hypothetical protein
MLFDFKDKEVYNILSYFLGMSEPDDKDEPQSKAMKDLIERARYSDGVMVESLKPGDQIVVVTTHHAYAFNLKDPVLRSAVCMSNGEYITRPCEVRINGSRLWSGGVSFRQGWIGIGYCLEIVEKDGDRQFLKLSPTREIFINNIKILESPSGLM